MAYIGNTVENQGFTPAIDYFNGNGVTVTFTLSRPIASVAQVIVAIDNVIQNPSSSFTIAGNAITFSSAPLSGTNNIWVEYTSLITTYQAISQDPTVIGDIRATGGYLAEGDFGNSFVDGAILDYVTGLGRITVGDADGLAIYNGGTASRTALMTVAATGNVGIGTTSPQGKLAISASGAQGLEFLTSSATSIGIQSYNRSTSAYIDQNYVGSTYTWTTGGVGERMRINSAGNVQLSTAGTRILNSSGNPILQQTGSVLQVITDTQPGEQATSSTSFVDTALSITITPTSTTSKIFLLYTGSAGNDGAQESYLTLVRNSTNLGNGTQGLMRIWYSGSSGYHFGGYSMSFLDSPATTSATTYKVQFRTNSGIVYISGGNSTDSFTVFEIAA